MHTIQETINQGDYVLVQRQDYMKLHRIKERNTVKLGPNSVECNALVGNKFLDHFKMVLKSKNLYALEKVDAVEDYSAIDIRESGADNRDILDDGTSQTLSKEEIEKLREESANSQEILEKLITNSKTFDKKTEYSQEKYLKKKEKKYYGYITVRRPTIRLLTNVFFKLDKTLGMRVDDLSQILTYANVQSGGKFILYDSGTNGLLPAAIMERIGAGNDGKLVYLYPGNENQRSCLQALGLPEEQYERCVPVNVHSVLRWLLHDKTTEGEYVLPAGQRKEFDARGDDGVAPGKRKLAEADDEASKRPKRPQWHYNNQAACDVLRAGVDGLIIASKEHPLSVVARFLDFVKASRSFAIFSAVREPLQDVYFALVNRRDVTNVKLTSSFVRQYQVLPERTHPLVNMTNGGFLLTGIKLVAQK